MLVGDEELIIIIALSSEVEGLELYKLGGCKPAAEADVVVAAKGAENADLLILRCKGEFSNTSALGKDLEPLKLEEE